MDKIKVEELDIRSPVAIRRRTGKYFTNREIGDYVADIIWKSIKPDVILEPFVGGGSLVTPFFKKNIHIIVNDVNKKTTFSIKKKFEDNITLYKSQDFITTPIKEIFEEWKIPRDRTLKFLVYSNPPFGTVSTNKLVTSTTELNSENSRNIDINYGDLAKKYGKGDLVIPAIGKMIQVIKHREKGYLAFFAPFGIFCERKRYKKLMDALFKDFVFLYGEIFNGDRFHSVSKNKPIGFTIWKYQPNAFVDHEKLIFFYQDKTIFFKRKKLLKDCWKYDTRKKITGEICVQGNDRFNAPVPKIFHIAIKKGGSELVPQNVKLPLDLEGIPDELFYGLWSITVGNRAIVPHPIYVDNAYTHLPDMRRNETFEIIAYSLLHSLITEIKNNYTQGKIGFFGENREFRFGNDRLTRGADFIIKKYYDLPINSTTTIGREFDRLRKIENFDTYDDKIRTKIKAQIQERLETIGYWGYVPLPEGSKKTRLSNFF
ncbi:MAG: hypothetical protein ACTSW1_12170 [Candidatus Hodarchaeales archaeon]